MKKKKIVWVMVFCLTLLPGLLYGQGKYLSNNGSIRFFSHTPVEDITADNGSVSSVIDAASGEVAIIVTMSDFQFEKKLMQEHFNENYVESEKYPKARFSGQILNNREVDYAAKGNYPVTLQGDLVIHGVSNNITVEGSIEVIEGGIISRTKFLLNPEDYNIKIPKVVRKNIAEQLEITVTLENQPI